MMQIMGHQRFYIPKMVNYLEELLITQYGPEVCISIILTNISLILCIHLCKRSQASRY